jgi:hypothetical protein
MKYPLTCLTKDSKLGFLFSAQETLQIEHNKMGAWYDPDKPSILLAEYQALRAKVQQAFPFSEDKLSKSDWDKYLKERFDVKQNIIITTLCGYKQALKSKYSVNLDDDII